MTSLAPLRSNPSALCSQLVIATTVIITARDHGDDPHLLEDPGCSLIEDANAQVITHVSPARARANSRASVNLLPAARQQEEML